MRAEEPGPAGHDRGGHRRDATRALSRWAQTLRRLYSASQKHSVSTLDRSPQKHLILILARELASNLATPTLIADAEGTLVFYNEAAEELVGRPFTEAGEMPVDEWATSFEPRTLGGEPVPVERLPTRIALDEQRPTHHAFRVTSADGVDRKVAVTAFPLFAHSEEFVGIVAIWWRE
jgi:PAS domain-containing protein